MNVAGTASGCTPNERGTRGIAGMGRNLRNSVPRMTRKRTLRRRPPGSRAAPGGPNRGVATRIGTWRGPGGATRRAINTTKSNHESLKSNHLASRVFPVVEGVCVGVKVAWPEFEDAPDLIKSIRSRKRAATEVFNRKPSTSN